MWCFEQMNVHPSRMQAQAIQHSTQHTTINFPQTSSTCLTKEKLETDSNQKNPIKVYFMRNVD
jgi:hypothetical protein